MDNVSKKSSDKPKISSKTPELQQRRPWSSATSLVLWNILIFSILILIWSNGASKGWNGGATANIIIIFMLAPVILTTAFVDIYLLVKRFKKK